MNTELVEQIAKKATECYSNGQELTFNKEMFAELIIKKCIEIDIENPDARPGLEIANYFGVNL